MDSRTKTCLFCLKSRQILVDNPQTAKAITEIYNVELPQDGCRICIECHFNIAQVREFKRTIENAADYDVDSCFVCKSENTVNEPGVDRVVDYLIKQCTTIDFGNTDTIKACVTCIHVLDTSIKYEKLARNYANAQRFCKQYSTLKECNVALWKIDLDALGEICDHGGSGHKGSKGPKYRKNNKRSRSSTGADETPMKKSKLEDGTVLPVMLTKLTPTGAKKTSPPGPKGKSIKQNDKIFIKLPLFTKPKKKQQRKKFSAPHSPSRTIPASPSVDDLNRIFNVELRPLTVHIEHIDLSSYLNKTISLASRQIRKSKKEEFIGLDEEDVVEFQNTSMNSSIGKRKSILITDRTESPNSAKKKVQFSDSPSIKYVDKLNFSDDDNDKEGKPDDDADYEVKKSKKRSPKPQNGTVASSPENGKKPKGRPKKIIPTENGGEDAKANDTTNESAVSKDKEESTKESKKQGETKEDDEDTTKESQKVASDGDGNQETVSTQKQQDEQKPEDKTDLNAAEDKSAAVEEDKKDAEQQEKEIAEDLKNATPVEEPVSAEVDILSPEATVTAAMDTEDIDAAEPMKVDPSEQPPTDAEMKAVDSPEDVEMADSKSPPAEDVEMKEVDSGGPEPVAIQQDVIPSNDSPSDLTEKADAVTEPETTVSTKDSKPPIVEFETSDKEEEEMEKFKLTLSSILGEEISDSEHSCSNQGQQNTISKPEESDEQQHEEPKPSISSESAEKEEQKSEVAENTESEKPTDDKLDEQTAENESLTKKNDSFASLDDVDDISDDDDILNRLDDLDEPSDDRKQSPDLPPLGEDSL